MRDVQYDDSFYKDIIDGSTSSARMVVPTILKILKDTKSVVDFGCGAGAWLHEFQVMGCEIQGYDFGVGCDDNLCIPANFFRKMPVNQYIATKKYDLAISLEVAEHIPHDENALYLQNITNAADILLFSAAIPNQGGTDHCNEQWPHYWIQRIAKMGFTVFDVLRPMLWYNTEIKWWYKQNLFLFVRNTVVNSYPELQTMASFHNAPIVHPDLFFQNTKNPEKHTQTYQTVGHDHASVNALVYKERYTAMQNSLSWKVTAPLRFGLDCIYKLTRGKK